MNHSLVKKAMKEAFLELMNLEPAELRRQIEEHADGPLANLFFESGMIAGRELLADDRPAPIHYFVEPTISLSLTVQSLSFAWKSSNQLMMQPGAVTVTKSPGVQSNEWNTIPSSDSAPPCDVNKWAA